MGFSSICPGFAASNISETYDAKIFSVATLLSSYLIYNSVKVQHLMAFSYTGSHSGCDCLCRSLIKETLTTWSCWPGEHRYHNRLNCERVCSDALCFTAVCSEISDDEVKVV